MIIKLPKKLYTLLYIFMIFVLMAGCSKSEAGVANNDAESNFIEYLLTEDSFKYSESILCEWKKQDKYDEIVKKCTNKDGKSEFILGSLTLFDGDIENAATYFDSAAEEAAADDIRLKARSLYELSKCYIYMEQFDKAEETIARMTQLFDKKENKDYLIVLNMWLCYDVVAMPSGFSKAVSVMKETYEIARETDYNEIERVLEMLAKCYMFNAEVVKSMNTYIEALDIAKTNDNKEMIIRISSGIASESAALGNNKEALKYYDEAYQLIKQDKSISQDTLTYGIYSTDGMFQCYLNENDLEMAWFYLNESREFINKQEAGKVKEDNLTKHYLSLGEYYVAKDNVKKAIEYLKMAEDRFNSETYFNYTNFDIELYTAYGDAYLAKRDYDKALEYYKKVEKLYSYRFDSPPDKYCLEGFYETYKGKGEYDKACRYAELMYEALNESYISQEQQYATYMVEKYQNEQNEEKISKLQERNRKLLYVVIIVCVLIAIFTLLLISIHNRTKKIELLNQKLKEIGENDGLTGLFNRRAMNDYLRENWDMIVKQELPVTMIMMDVDYFKKYNDCYGHQMGDEVLSQIGKIIATHTRKSDFAVRYGGEEFLIIMPKTSENEAFAVAEKIKESVDRLQIPHEKSQVNDYVTISMGIYSANENMSSSDVLGRADQTLYEAKKTRNTIQIYKNV